MSTTSKISKSSGVYFGWWIVLACSIIGFLGVGIASAGLSVLFKPIAAELGLSRAAASWASGIQSIGQGISGLTGGRATDRYGPRRIILIGIIFLFLGLIAMYFVNSLWTFLLAWGLLVGIGFSFGCTFVTDAAIVRWFIRRSGIAINAKFAFQALSGIILLPVIAWFVTNHGWRITSVGAAVIIGVVCIPLAWFLVKPHPPEHYGLPVDGIMDKPVASRNDRPGTPVNEKTVEFTLKQTLRSPAYWGLIFVSYLSAAAAPIMGVHCIPFLTDRGINPVQAAGMMAIVLTSGIPVRLVTGFLLDRVKTSNLRFMTAAGFVMQAAGVATFLVFSNTTGIYIWFFLYGIGHGISQGVQIPLWARYFGRKAYGAILGSTMAAGVPIALAAPVIIGSIYDHSGSYMIAIVALAICSALASILVALIKPPRPQPAETR